MTKFIRKLEVLLGKKGLSGPEKGTSVKGHDRKSEMSRSKHVLDNISAQDFTQHTGLPAKYRETIAVFSDIVDARRNEVCHDTEFEFARLLLTRQFKDPVNAQLWNCDHWALLLLWVTGYTTLEDMAAIANDVKPHPIR